MPLSILVRAQPQFVAGIRRDSRLEVRERQFVRVRSQLPHKSARHAVIQRAIKPIAHKWKRWGGDQQELLAETKEIVAEVFDAEGQFIFTEYKTIY